jgi:hypothetical protein
MLPLVVTAALALSAQAPAPAPSSKKEMHTPAKGTIVVGKQATNGGKGPSFEIAVGNCTVAKGAPKGTPPDCAVFVSLGRGKPEKLQWTAKPGAIYQQDDHTVAIGDEADSALAISWAPVTIAKGIDGVIVTQQSGGDRVKHRHDVFLNLKGRLNYALTASEPRGPMTWSSITPLDLDNNGGQELLLMQASRPDEEDADRWQMEVYGWRADVAKIVKLPSWTPTIHAAMVGSFATVAEARELQGNKCLREFIVMSSKSAPLLQEGIFAVAYPAATPRDADLALEAAKACDDELVGAVKVVSRGMDVPQE